jgi:hypothetical protein
MKTPEGDKADNRGVTPTYERDSFLGPRRRVLEYFFQERKGLRKGDTLVL